MSLEPVRRCEECGYETTAKTDVCLSCGESLRPRAKGGVRGLIRSLILVAIALYILLSSFKVFGLLPGVRCCG
ncbi:MAG: hypothetical protein OXF23_03080 [Candidatus Dadabacteria bacterium]|nr:hypothetical protein [Candidatus Dadabacteria bacterium]MCY4262574.1 hypothetical protein [Candidatus Dadabacteria bacterium]